MHKHSIQTYSYQSNTRIQACLFGCIFIYVYSYENVGVNVNNVFQNGWANLDEIVNGIVRVSEGRSLADGIVP